MKLRVADEQNVAVGGEPTLEVILIESTRVSDNRDRKGRRTVRSCVATIFEFIGHGYDVEAAKTFQCLRDIISN